MKFEDRRDHDEIREAKSPMVVARNGRRRRRQLRKGWGRARLDRSSRARGTATLAHAAGLYSTHFVRIPKCKEASTEVEASSLSSAIERNQFVFAFSLAARRSAACSFSSSSTTVDMYV